jgi:hypothetical protein
VGASLMLPPEMLLFRAWLGAVLPPPSQEVPDAQEALH